MPYKSEKAIKLVGTDKDRRVKLSPEQKDEIASLKGVISCNECARIYGVNKRTISFIWYPERLERNKQLRKERGGWKQYFEKDKHREYIKKYRHHKQELYIQENLPSGKIHE